MRLRTATTIFVYYFKERKMDWKEFRGLLLAFIGVTALITVSVWCGYDRGIEYCQKNPSKQDSILFEVRRIAHYDSLLVAEDTVEVRE